MKTQQVDYCIVGQGLAGSILAYLLIERGRSVVLFDDEAMPSSSSVAAGIFNPVTGKRLVKTWLADALFPFLIQFYESIENKLGAKFLHQTGVYRPYANLGEQNTFLARTNSEELRNWVQESTQSNEYEGLIYNELGGIQIQQSGWVDIPNLLLSLKSYLHENCIVEHQTFNFEALLLCDNSVNYQQYHIQKVIFCEGVHAQQNPFFRWLPFNPAKGEILSLTMNDYSIKEIVSQGIFIVNHQNGKVKVGATYEWANLDNTITDTARVFLEEKLSKLLKTNYEIVKQQAGIRPSTTDRRPFVGLHPGHQSLAIFNGMGSKGTSLIPYFANQLLEFLENGIQIQPEANIERHYSLYFGK